VHNETVSRARRQLSHDATPDDERIGRDGKSYSIRQRVTGDPDIPQKLVEAAAATGRRRVFLRCHHDDAAALGGSLPRECALAICGSLLRYGALPVVFGSSLTV
jgi:hypothetical protein